MCVGAMRWWMDDEGKEALTALAGATKRSTTIKLHSGCSPNIWHGDFSLFLSRCNSHVSVGEIAGVVAILIDVSQ